MEVLNRIDEKALELYGRYGVKPVTMDDVARACGISKKTLYANYANKAELVNGVFARLMSDLRTRFTYQVLHAKDAISEALVLLRNYYHFCKSYNYIMIEDLEKYYYETWKVFAAFREESGVKVIKRNIERGVAEGLFHDEFNKDIIAQMRMQQLLDIHRTAHTNHNLSETLYDVSKHYLAGLSTDKGKKILEKYINNKNKSLAE